MKVAKDVMTRDVLRVQRTDTVAQAAEMMKQRGIHSLLVDRASPLDAYAIITDTDVVAKVVAQGRAPKQVKVQEVMTSPIITIPPDCALQDAAQLMARNHINHLPVFDGRELVGMLSSTDIFNVK